MGKERSDRVGQHVMSAEAAVRLLDQLTQHGVDACVGGGWAVDALLGQQTRSHSDLDLWLSAADLEPLFVALAACGVDRVLPWPGDRPWNFVLHDGAQLRVDLHLYEWLPQESWHYGSVRSPQAFPAAALTGHGVIAGHPVRCEAPDWALQCHTGYPVRPIDRHDVPLLCARFGLDVPAAYC